MMKLTHLFLLLAAAAAAVSASAASSSNSASLRRAVVHQSARTVDVRRSVQEETEEQSSEVGSENVFDETASDTENTSNNNNDQNRQRNRNRNKNTGEDETTPTRIEYVTAPNVFKAQTDATILFASFSTSSMAEYGFALIFVAVLAFSLETLIACQRDDWIGLEISNDKERAKSYVCSAIILTVLRMLSVTLGLILILVVSSFNVGIFIATILGSGIAHFIFSLKRLKKESKTTLKRRDSGHSDDATEKAPVSPEAAPAAPAAVPTVKESTFQRSRSLPLPNNPDQRFKITVTNGNDEEGTHRTDPVSPDDFTQGSITAGGYSQRSSSRPTGSSRRGGRTSTSSQRSRRSVPNTISLASVDEESALESTADFDRRQLREVMRTRSVPVATAVALETPAPAPTEDDFSIDSPAQREDSFDENERVECISDPPHPGVSVEYSTEQTRVRARLERMRALRHAASLDITVGDDVTVASDRSEI